MLRRLKGVLAPTVLALAATFCGAKPPDLPEKLKITVDACPLLLAINPIQAMADDCPCPCPFRACPDKHSRAEAGPLAERSVLENLERLLEAGDELEMAKKHAQAGEAGPALERLARVHALVPGSNVDAACAGVVGEVVARLFACPSIPAAVGGEMFVRQFGMCWMWQASKMCEAACASEAGKAVMVDGLMKSAHLALGEGRVGKARELVLQAHALDATRVEADPLAYKMGLLPIKDALGGEQPCDSCPLCPKRQR